MTSDLPRTRICETHCHSNLAASAPINSVKLRVRFAVFDAKRYDQRLTSIKESNLYLEKVISVTSVPGFSTLDFEPQERQLIRAPYIAVRPLIRTLYDAIRISLYCDHDYKHDAKLCLVPVSNGEQFYFHFLISH